MAHEETDLFPDDPVADLEKLMGLPFQRKLEEVVGDSVARQLIEAHDGAKPAIIKSVRVFLRDGILPERSTGKSSSSGEEIQINNVVPDN